MTREARHVRCPESVLGWIPWYADGGLSDRQKGAVEAHAAECADCRAELDIVAGAPFEIDVDLPDPDRLFGEITARIHASEHETGVTGRSAEGSRALRDDELDRIGRWILDESVERAIEDESRVIAGPWSLPGVALAAAAALALLFLGGIGGSLLASSGAPSLDEPIYRSATAPAETESTEAKAPMLDVVFVESASARDISTALRSVGVEIVSGPTSLGVYRLRLIEPGGDGRAPSGADVAAVAARLKAPESAVAIFAEAVP